MIGKPRTHRIFGPKIRRPTWYSSPVQRGEGLGSFFAKMGRKLIPLAKKAIPLVSRGIEKVAKSKTAQEIGRSLLERGTDAAAELASNVILGNPNADSLSLAQERLQSARADIAKLIREAPKRVLSESDSSEIDVPIKRQKSSKRKKKKQTSIANRNKKKYNLLKNIS